MKKQLGRLFVLLLLLLSILAFFAFDLHRFFDLEYLKSQQGHFRNIYQQSPLQTIALFMLVYIVSTALSLPGAALLTLLGGTLFGLFVGTIVVSFASTIGASLAFLVARFLMKESVQKRFGQQFHRFNQGVEKEGAFYLFSLRLIPLIPFFVVNLVMGLTPMRLLTFFVVSQVGMLPGTIVYVNAGTELGKIDSLAGILSPRLWLSFALLGLFPIITKKIMSLIKSKRGASQHG
jgi:uncharacterized membrane protein YdjX (TVP38/TMEM64 family)